MYVKLMNPRTKNSMVFQANEEVYFGPNGAMTQSEQDAWVEMQESLGNDPRRFVLWPSPSMISDKVMLAEIHIPGSRASKGGGVVLLTNWDGWLVNENGRTMERVSRAPSAE